MNSVNVVDIFSFENDFKTGTLVTWQWISVSMVVWRAFALPNSLQSSLEFISQLYMVIAC